MVRLLRTLDALNPRPYRMLHDRNHRSFRTLRGLNVRPLQTVHVLNLGPVQTLLRLHPPDVLPLALRFLSFLDVHSTPLSSVTLVIHGFPVFNDIFRLFMELPSWKAVPCKAKQLSSQAKVRLIGVVLEIFTDHLIKKIF